MRNSQTQMPKSSVEMEEYVFQKAHSRVSLFIFSKGGLINQLVIFIFCSDFQPFSHFPVITTEILILRIEVLPTYKRGILKELMKRNILKRFIYRL